MLQEATHTNCDCNAASFLGPALCPQQGGTVALELARQQAAAGSPLRSCVTISASLLPEQLLAEQPAKAATGGGGSKQGGTPVLMTHGSRDNGGC